MIIPFKTVRFIPFKTMRYSCIIINFYQHLLALSSEHLNLAYISWFNSIRSDKNAPARWYYWKIPTDDVTVWTRLFPWSCYVLHQLLIWTAIYWAQTDKVRGSNQRLKRGISKLNGNNFIYTCMALWAYIYTEKSIQIFHFLA